MCFQVLYEWSTVNEPHDEVLSLKNADLATLGNNAGRQKTSCYYMKYYQQDCKYMDASQEEGKNKNASSESGA